MQLKPNIWLATAKCNTWVMYYCTVLQHKNHIHAPR